MATDDFLSTLELSVRAANVLRTHELDTPQLFYNLTQKHFLSLRGAGRRSWNEIAEIQRHLRQERRKETVLGCAAQLVQKLNQLPLESEGCFITKDRLGRLRIARFIDGKDLDGSVSIT